MTGVLLYGLYTPLVGVLNGRPSNAAALDALFATLRTIGLLAVEHPSSSAEQAEGALAGFVAAACLIVVITAPCWVRRSGSEGLLGAHLRFIAPLLGGQLALNLLFQCDPTR